MIEMAVAIAAVLITLGVMWWRDAHGPSGWEDLLAPDMLELQQQIAWKFETEERAARYSGGDAEYLAGLVPGRLAILRRLAVYERILSAAARPPDRLAVRLRVLQRGFKVLARPRANVDTLAALDRQALESCRVLIAAAGLLEVGRPQRR